MKMFFKMRYVQVYWVLATAILFVLMVAPIAHAATTPYLGAATTYGVLGSTYTNTVAGTTITGDVGFTTGPAVAPAGVQTNYGPGAPYATAGINQGSALSALASQTCTFNFAPGAINLSTDTTHGPVGVYTPGVYCSTGAMNVGGPLTLNGSGTYIFRPVGALTSTAGSVITLTGASACDVFWTPTQATSLAASTTFVGTVIDASGVTVGANVTWSGRALAFGGTILTDTDTITVPTCPVVSPPSSNTPAPLINVKKVPNPLALPAGPGSVTYTYTVTNPINVILTDVTLKDDKCSAIKFISGDTNANGWLESNETWTYTCTTILSKTTVNYATARGLGNGMAAVDTAIAEVVVGVPVVPPLIHIVKTPSPLTLAFNGGSVTYSYVVTNPGTVPLSSVTVTDNKCSNMTFVSGDGNSDSKLGSDETWRYTCTTNVPQTTTNTAVATGHANGLTAIDTALATVIVAGSPIPPLIHIIKKADPVIFPAAGGLVTYTYNVTNPGTVALNNVSVIDDKCGPVTLTSGDTDSNGLMESGETWIYSCQQNLNKTTINTAIAEGSANGLSVTDVAVASVVLSPALLPPTPKLPNTGFYNGNGTIGWASVAAGILVAATLLFAVTQRKRLS